MSACTWVLVPLGQTEVDDVDDVLLLAEPDQEIVWLYVSVEETVLMDEFNTLEQLNREHEHRF